ncbi:MAG: DUF3179 domain-containing protein [Phycisphaerales bacterium]|nr:DUF3179 domain-containing protein [Phycisphaerae bacterium]NNF44539.1 DUF3179 domain-containing protein [Phycisphaerales bacterium]NNM26015.1 DUF3179 domain-containing protein [Phycisphaerales bacterium]
MTRALWILFIGAAIVAIASIALARWPDVFAAGATANATTLPPRPPATAAPRGPERYLQLLSAHEDDVAVALSAIEDEWDDTHAVVLLETSRLTRRPVTHRILGQLARMTGQDFGLDVDRWYEWIWASAFTPPEWYPAFKRALYTRIDPRFDAYFPDTPPPVIRLDEVRWGGVKRDGIPPLESPSMITAAAATYLDDGDVVFGVAVNGDVRAYPKRILAWHELFRDTIGGVPVAGVYCTLCGSMIVYESTVEGTTHTLGTSGFLYRSNKLMYDHATESLWSTLEGRPVVGPLATEDISLASRSVVTTTWGAWRRRHPGTTVLAIDTGHRRDYREGAAYRRYFATDELMFTVPSRDVRLPNKAEILALRGPDGGHDTLAIEAAFLAERPVYHDVVGGQRFVVLTDGSGANRVFATGATTITAWDGTTQATDDTGRHWRVTEAALVRADGGARAARMSAHRAFWFGWFAAYPRTRLVHRASSG